MKPVWIEHEASTNLKKIFNISVRGGNLCEVQNIMRIIRAENKKITVSEEPICQFTSGEYMGLFVFNAKPILPDLPA